MRKQRYGAQDDSARYRPIYQSTSTNGTRAPSNDSTRRSAPSSSDPSYQRGQNVHSRLNRKTPLQEQTDRYGRHIDNKRQSDDNLMDDGGIIVLGRLMKEPSRRAKIACQAGVSFSAPVQVAQRFAPEDQLAVFRRPNIAGSRATEATSISSTTNSR